MLGFYTLASAKALMIYSFDLALLRSLLWLSFLRTSDINSFSPAGPKEIIVSATIYLFYDPSFSTFIKRGMACWDICCPKLAMEVQAAVLTFQ